MIRHCKFRPVSVIDMLDIYVQG